MNQARFPFLPALSAAIIILGLSIPFSAYGVTDPLPDSMENFEGVVEGRVKWVHNSTWWMVMNLDKAVTTGGEVIQPSDFSNKDFRITIRWRGRGNPHPETHAIVKAAKPGDRLVLRVGAKDNDLRIHEKADAKDLSELADPQHPELVWENLGARIDENTIEHVLRVGSGGDYSSIKAAYQVAHEHLSNGEPVKILLAKGVYRESLGTIEVNDSVRDTLLVIEGTGPAETVWSGSNIWDPEKWTELEGGLYVADWPHSWGNFSTPWETPEVLGHRSEMIFVDGELMTQVLLETYDYDRSGKMIDHGQRKQTWVNSGVRDPKKALPPGTFGVTERPKSGGKIYIRLPDDKRIPDVTIEVSERRNLFFFRSGSALDPGKNNFVLRGIAIRHFASRTKGWGAESTIALGRGVRDILIENCLIEWNNARGINISAKHITLRNNQIRFNGFGGLGGEFGYGQLEDNSTNFNNWRGAWGGLRGWNWGGTKFGGYDGSHHWVKGHESIGNLAPGFWYDIHPQNIIVEDLVSVENDGPGLFLELSQGPFTVERALLAQNLKNQFKSTIVGEFILEDSILYSNRAPMIDFKGGEIQRSLAEILWYLRTDEHALRQTIVPTEFKLGGNILLGGGELTAILTEHVGINRQHNWYGLADRAYRGSGNLFYSEGGTLDFFYVHRNWQVQTVDLEGWQSHTREIDPILDDPGFVDPAKLDFRLRPDSPLKNRADELPTLKIDPDKIVEARRFREWVNLGIVLDGRDPAVRVKEE